MNAEEAKIPDVDGHWESIEIFLFSNGQQYSPPRKYHLRADELDLWDETLNLLAQSHYGLRSPPIDMYTTDGQLVEGPLELKDGLAYVAVTRPDTFVDAGYQKYLIRASRSWEKRQARKQIPECVIEDSCCLCPEKEWCCDLQTCCYCPEKGAEDSLESLLCATGHPELRPAGGHFMSSAPSKPAATDDYRPKSGKIAYTAGEHVAKPDKYLAKLGEYEARLNENESRLGEFRTRPDEYGAKLNENEIRPGEYEAYLGENAARSNKNGASPGEFKPRPDENIPISSKNGVRPSDYKARPVENETRLSINAAKSSGYGARPSINGAKPDEYVARPGEYESRPRENEAKPGEYETRQSVNGAKMGERRASSGELAGRSVEQRTRPDEYGPRSAKDGALSDKDGVRPTVHEARRGNDGPEIRPGQYETSPTVNGAESSEYKARPGENRIRPSVNAAKSDDYGVRPIISGPKPDEYGARPGEYGNKPNVNGAKMSEYGARSGEFPGQAVEQRTRPDEYGLRSAKGGTWSEDGVRTTVHEARPGNDGPETRPGEYETRPTVNVAESSEYKARPGENRIRPSVNAAKSDDYGVRPIISGPKPDEYGARPGEYGNKPNVNGAKMSEYGARSGEFPGQAVEQRTRPDEYGLRSAKGGTWSEDGVRTTVHEARPGNDGPETRPGEYETRPTVNGVKPSEYKARPGENRTIASVNAAKSDGYGTRASISGPKPDEYVARPGEYETKPIVNGVRHSVNEARSLNVTKPSEYKARPGENGAKPSVYKARPGEYGAKLGEYKPRPTVNETMLGELRARPGKNETRRSVNVAKPSEYEARTGEYESRPRENGAKPGEYETRQSVNGAKMSEYGARLGKFADRSVEQRTRPDEYGPRSAKDGALSDEDGVRSTKHEARRGNDESETRPGEYETRPTVNGAEPSEYKARPIVNGAEPSEYKARTCENGAKPSEYKARPGECGAKLGEYEPRPTINEAIAGEHSARPGENVIRRSVNGAGPSEYGTGMGEYESRPRETGAKPGEYETRQCVNGAKIDEYRARSGEFADRSVEQRTRSDEYGPRLAKGGARSDEDGVRSTVHEARPGNDEPKTRPGEYATRPTVNGVKPSDYTARLGENGNRPSVNAAKPDGYGAKSSEYETRQSVNGAKMGENRARSGELANRSVDQRTRSDEYGPTSAKGGAWSDEDGVRPTVHESRPENDEPKTRPGEYATRPTVNEAEPSEYKARPGENGAKPSVYKAKPGEYESRPTVNEAMLGERKAKPGENETKWSVNGTKPSEYGARTSEYESEPRENGAKPGEYETILSVNGAKMGEYRSRSGAFADRSVEQRTRPDEYGPTSAKVRAWSDEDGVRPTVHEARPGNDAPRSNEIESKKEAYKIGLRDNEISLDDNVDRPDKDTVYKDAGKECKFRKQSSTLSPIDESEFERKGEYGVTEGDQKDKQIDPKGRASESGGKGGRRVNAGEQSGRENYTVTGMSEPRAIQNENARRSNELRPSGIENKRIPSQQRGGIEQTRRLSGRAGADTKQDGRTGDLTREFEHGGRMSEQKGREANPVGRAGMKVARLSEQRNKQSDNLARLGGRETRVGDHEARAGDIGLIRSDHDARLNPVSRIPNPSAGVAVSGSRANPRNRISNLGQPRLGTPGTRVDETAARLDVSEIKNRVGYPGPRQSSVAGTGAAGASLISEAQQHARRSGSSAGTAATEKKRLSIGQNSSLLRKPTPISSVLRKSEDKQSIKNNKETLPKRITGKVSAIPVPASNDAGQSKTLPKDPYKHITPPALQPPTISTTNLVNLGTNEAPLENVMDEKEIIVVSTHSFRDSESEIRSMRLDSVKKIVDILKNSPKGTQTELIYVEKSKVSVTVNEGVQTNIEAVEQHRQELSTSSKAKVNSCTCTCDHCCKRDQRLATVDPDENIISIQNKGDVIKLKLNIEVWNILRSVYSCQNNCLNSRSLTNITRSEKESELSIDDGMLVRCKSSLQSILNHQCFRGYGFESSPKLMVVQCAGCGRLNYQPRCDLPPCCDNNKKYFVLLANSLNEDMDEDMDDCCNFNPPCRPCRKRQSQLKKSSSGIPIKQTLSEMTLDTIATVTVSEVPLQRREMGKKTDMACQTEEPQGECMMTKRKVSISEDSCTRCDYQKESSSLISVTNQVDNLKTKNSRKISQPVTSCQKVQSVCSQVSLQTSSQVQSKGCMTVSPTSSTCCPKPLPSIQIQTQLCLQVPQVSDSQTQTRWNSIVLQARLHPDGRYSFHLPPLNVLKIHPF